MDDGAAFRSKQLPILCAKLGVAPIHAKRYTPQGEGKMDRWFRTVRLQFLPLIPAPPNRTPGWTPVDPYQLPAPRTRK